MAATHQNTEVRTVGRSFEGREIKLFSIARSPVSFFNFNKIMKLIIAFQFNRNIIIEANIHARKRIAQLFLPIINFTEM
jgi:hypothetical protein